MFISSAYFAPDRYGPDHMALEAFVKDSEEEWMKIIRERRNEIIGLPVCFLICVLKRWITTLNMMADFQRPIFIHRSWKTSILYQYIQNDTIVASVEEWLKLPFLSFVLLVASRDGYTEGVKALLKVESVPNDPAHFYSSILLNAVLSRNIETVRALLDAGVTDSFAKHYGMTAAAQAARLGELEIMREIGWSANDDLLLERGVRGGHIKVVKAIIAVRTEKFDLKRVSRFTKNESLHKLLSETNATLPEKPPTSTVSRWRWFSAKPKQSKTVSKKLA